MRWYIGRPSALGSEFEAPFRYFWRGKIWIWVDASDFFSCIGSDDAFASSNLGWDHLYLLNVMVGPKKTWWLEKRRRGDCKKEGVAIAKKKVRCAYLDRLSGALYCISRPAIYRVLVIHIYLITIQKTSESIFLVWDIATCIQWLNPSLIFPMNEETLSIIVEELNILVSLTQYFFCTMWNSATKHV